MKRHSFFITIFVSLFLLCGCANCNSCNELQPVSFEINFIIDGEPYLSDTVDFGKTIEKPVIEEKQGYVFKGWYVTDDYVEEWNFETQVYNPVTLYAYWVETEKETFNVIYTDDGIPVHTEKVLKGSCTEKFIPEEKEGYTFSGWTYNGQAYDFSSAVYCDITLTAEWTAIEYKVTFTADGQIIAEEYFTADNLLVTIPDLPKKEHYTAEWETFIYELKDIEVQAIYTAISYTATFYVDNEIYREFTYTVEDEIDIPEVPSKIGYIGSWDGLPIAGGNVTINAVYTPIDYTITYKIDSEVVDTQTYNAEAKDVTPPEIPEIPGYEGFWEDVELDTGDKTVNAYYTVKELYAYFYVDEELYETRTFTVENKHIDVPDVPPKEGYTCLWESYELGCEDITINAIYIKEVYTASFMIDNEVIDSIEFTFDDATLTEPAIPDKFQKDGYTVSWEQYTLDSGDISIEAIYTPITYTAQFVIDDQLICEAEFTVEDKYINEPEIANKYQKKGYTARWEDYSIIADDIVIDIEYTLITYYASFMCDGTLIEKVPYTINDKTIKEPVPPQREGYVAVWDVCTIPYKDFQIDLQYYEIKQTETVGNLQFTLLNNTYSLTQYLNSSEASESVVEIPAEVNHIPVSTIAEQAFSFKKNFNELIIPDSVTEIGSHAFSHTNIEKIKLPSGLTHIKNIFVGCAKLESVVIPSNVKFIDANAFNGCTYLKNIIFENCDNWHLYKDNEYKEEIKNDDVYDKLSYLLANPATASEYLTVTWVEYYLKRES